MIQKQISLSNDVYYQTFHVTREGLCQLYFVFKWLSATMKNLADDSFMILLWLLNFAFYFTVILIIIISYKLYFWYGMVWIFFLVHNEYSHQYFLYFWRTQQTFYRIICTVSSDHYYWLIQFLWFLIFIYLSSQRKHNFMKLKSSKIFKWQEVGVT